MSGVQLSQNSRVLALVEKSLFYGGLTREPNNDDTVDRIYRISTLWQARRLFQEINNLCISNVSARPLSILFREPWESHGDPRGWMDDGTRRGEVRDARVNFITFSKYQGDTGRREGNCLRMLIRCRWMNDLMGMSRRIYSDPLLYVSCPSSREHIVPYIIPTSLRILSSKLYVLSLCTLGFGPTSRANTVASLDLRRAVGSPVSHATQ